MSAAAIDDGRIVEDQDWGFLRRKVGPETLLHGKVEGGDFNPFDRAGAEYADYLWREAHHVNEWRPITHGPKTVVILGARRGRIVILYVWSSSMVNFRGGSTRHAEHGMRHEPLAMNRALAIRTANEFVDPVTPVVTSGYPRVKPYGYMVPMYGMDVPCREAQDALFYIQGTFSRDMHGTDWRTVAPEELIIELSVPNAVWGHVVGFALRGLAKP